MNVKTIHQLLQHRSVNLQDAQSAERPEKGTSQKSLFKFDETSVLPNSYLLKRLQCKIHQFWKLEIVLSETFVRFPAGNIIHRISKMIE